MAQCSKTLLLIIGPTGVGKTELALRVAEQYGSPVVSCDSRQIYREIEIGTAAPTKKEQERVKHYFVGVKELDEDYNAGQYERDALTLLDQLFNDHNIVVMTGGSMMYADAVCNGLDDLPAIPKHIRDGVRKNYETNGLAWLQAEVERLDPQYWGKVDRQNPARLMHCVEICLTTGKAYSSLLSKKSGERPFRIIKVGLLRDRADLYARIDERVRRMVRDGLVEEAKNVYGKRKLNSLQTVGYKELFAHFDGDYDLERAIELIQQNSRHYAKRQMTWFRRDKEIHWLDANEKYEKNISIIDALLDGDGLQASEC